MVDLIEMHIEFDASAFGGSIPNPDVIEIHRFPFLSSVLIEKIIPFGTF